MLLADQIRLARAAAELIDILDRETLYEWIHGPQPAIVITHDYSLAALCSLRDYIPSKYDRIIDATWFAAFMRIDICMAEELEEDWFEDVLSALFDFIVHGPITQQ